MVEWLKLAVRLAIHGPKLLRELEDVVTTSSRVARKVRKEFLKGDLRVTDVAKSLDAVLAELDDVLDVIKDILDVTTKRNKS